ncbi:MAG: class I SAM-dependent methyltransferase [Solirubrobacteraceae bacterium]
MRDRWDITERLFAAYYPKIARRSEEAGQRETRAGLLAAATGRTLEVGTGNGFNLEHYPPTVTELVLSDPSPHMLDALRATIAERPPAVGSWEIVQAGLEDLPFADGEFQTVVCTYVLCSVSDPRRALQEITRVLAAGGRLLFLEHVRDAEGTALGRIQDLIEVPHRLAAAGCRPNRRTAELIKNSPLALRTLSRERQPSSLPTVAPIIVGSAERA